MTMTKPRLQLARLAALLKSEEGQGMSEYASISSMLAIAVLLGVGGTPVFQNFMEGYQNYMSSIFFVLTVAFP